MSSQKENIFSFNLWGKFNEWRTPKIVHVVFSSCKIFINVKKKNSTEWTNDIARGEQTELSTKGEGTKRKATDVGWMDNSCVYLLVCMATNSNNNIITYDLCNRNIVLSTQKVRR